MLAHGRLEFGPYRAEAGLLDEDPVVRWTTIRSWNDSLADPSAEVQERLRRDPVESVRLEARERFPAR